MKNFMKCGVCGWCLELIWTGLHSFLERDYRLMGQSSVWMFPIYGLAAVIAPVSRRLDHLGIAARGLIYMNGIFSVEYLTGFLLKKQGICPWDYSSARLNYRGLIRLDYAPLWFCTGLLFERLLNKR